jgi:hypothetical protein
MSIDLWADHANVRAVTVMMRLARMRLEAGRSPAPWYRAAGQHLVRLHRGRGKRKWAQLVRDECGVGLTRAFELVALGRGKTLAELRAENSGRVKKSRSRKALPRPGHTRNPANRRSGTDSKH